MYGLVQCKWTVEGAFLASWPSATYPLGFPVCDHFLFVLSFENEPAVQVRKTGGPDGELGQSWPTEAAPAVHLSHHLPELGQGGEEGKAEAG